MSSTSYPLDPLDSQLKFEWSNQTESLENLFKIFQEPFQSPVPIPRELITPVKRNQETDSKPIPPQDQNKQFYTQPSPIYSPNSNHLQNQNKVNDSAHLVQLPLDSKEELHKNSSAQVSNYPSQLVNDPNNYINYAQEYMNHNASQQQRNMNPSTAAYTSPMSIPSGSTTYSPNHPPAQHFNSQYVSSQQLNQLHSRFQNGSAPSPLPQPNNNNYNAPTPSANNNYPASVYTQSSTPSYNPAPPSNQYSTQQEYHSNPPTHNVVQSYRDSPPISQQQYPSPQQQEFQQPVASHTSYSQQQQSQNTNKYQRSEPEYHSRVQPSNSQQNIDYSDYNHSIHQSSAPLDYQARSQQHQQSHQSSQQQHQQQIQSQQTHNIPIHSSQNRSPPQLQPQLQQQPQNQANNYNLTYIDSNAKEFALPTVAPPENKNLSIVPATILNGNSDAQYCDITEYLNYPQIEAARKLHLPPSTLSKRWKEAAPNRKWPWRTVCKLDKEISTLLHNIPPDGTIPKQIEGKLAVLIQQRQEELKPIVIRL